MNTTHWLQAKLIRSASLASELLFPSACAACGDLCETSQLPLRSRLLCGTCEQQLWPRAGNFCPRCAMPYPDLPNPEGTCVTCRERKPAYDATRTLGIYEGMLRQAVLRMKHRAYELLAKQVGELLAERVREMPFTPAPSVVVPVPMHWLKRLWRGTNAAESLASSFAAALKVPLVSDLVRCKKWLAKQHHLPPSQRFDNVRHAYALGWGFDVRGANVLLVDDVVTTGATTHAIARVLKKAGAERVYVAAVARSIGDV
ncbi:ComF family protein [Anatilimnocola sp. NA78]|uniref:ComF family protein n=1 Tax=Anatilimnocola sp. NA78 TaxID=3415683 RepID=UPI003CE4D654